MKSIRSFYYIILLTWKIVNCDEEESVEVNFTQNIPQTNFVDPYSFDYDRANKKMMDKSKFQRSEGICVGDDQCRNELKKCRDDLNNIEFEKLYTARLINLLLSSAKLQEDGELLTGFIKLSGSKEQVEELRKFGNGKITMRQVDAILSSMITPTVNIIGEAITLFEQLRTTIYQYRKVSASVLFAIVILLLIRYVNWNTRKVVIVFVTSVFLTTYYMTWSQLIQDAELKKMVEVMRNKGQPPIDCEPDKMYFWEKIVTHFHGGDKCFEYYKALEFNAFHEVTAMDALTVVISRFTVYTVGTIGSSVDSFIENATKNLGYGTAWFLKPLLYIIIIVIIGATIFITMGGKIRFWLGPFAGISLTGGETNRTERQPALAEQRQPIDIQLRVVFPERNCAGELQQLSATPTPRLADDNKLAIGDGDAKIQEREIKPKDSGAVCSTCCCRGKSRESHIEEDGVDAAADKTRKSHAADEEKGDGDR